jgi:WD40 repeat protein
MNESKQALRTKRLTPAWETRLSDCVVALEWAANGELLAAATIDGKVSLVPKKGGEVLTVSAHANGMGALAWHPDQDLLVSAGQDGFVRAWHANGEQVWEHQAGKSWIEKVAWSPQPVKVGDREEKVLAVASGKELLLLNAGGQLIAKSEAMNTTLADLCWYPNGALVLAAAYGGLQVFHGASAKRLRTYEWKGAMWNCRWSPDGRWVAGGSQENAVHIWDANSGEHLHMPGYQAKIRTLDWNHTGKWLATGNGMDVLLWDCSGKGPNGRAPQMFGAHGQNVTGIRFRHGGDVFAAGGKDGNLMIWDANGEPEPLAAFIGTAEIGPVCWSPDDKLVAIGTANGEVIIF